ncbi:MAG: SUF system NifU family Fe-S cluster assembly protein [Candidatus Abawacabacteria bacterium]|nr:SUF system NifU family Fe-S cluster assembly protein [Candidatus Abawacabacteria bacterium]
MSLHQEITNQALTPEQEIYRENILDHYREPKNAGTLLEYDIKHRELNPLCGDEITVYILFDAKQKIKDIRFDGHGCAISQASMSMFTEMIQGKTVKEVAQIKKEDILKMLGIPIGIVRMKCALLSLRTVQKGLVQSKEQRAKSKEIMSRA